MKKIVFILTLIITISCSNQQNNNINIGVIMPLTGPVAEPGNNTLRGIVTAVEQFNSLNNKQINLIVEDSRSTSRDGVNALNKLISIDKTKIVIGDIMSSVVLASAPIAERNKVVYFTPGGSNPEIREAGDYIFRDYLSDDFDGKVMAQYVKAVLNKDKVAIISVNNDYGVGIENAFISSFEKLGGNITLVERHLPGQSDFRNIILKIKNSNADVLYIASLPRESGLLIRQLKELNVAILKTGNLSFENNEFINVALNSFDSIIFSSPYFDPNSEDERIISFVNLYKNKYDITPDIAAALGYDVASILIHVLQICNYDQSQVKDLLYTIKDFKGITGNTSFDIYGDVLKDIYVKKISGDGKINIMELFSIDKSNN